MRKRSPQQSKFRASDQAVLDRFNAAQDRLVLQSSDLSLETLASMVETDAIDIEPTYQRRERWRGDKQAALIESFLLNIPVPPIYLAEDEFGQYSVIDGKQRLTTIHSFMLGNLALTNLEDLTELEGRRIDQLPKELQNALRVRPYLRVVTILKQSDADLKYEVFTRLNTGGEPLNAQEIRNVAFRGPLNDLVYRLTDTPFLRRQLKITSRKSPAYRNMVDAEFVLRFLTLLENWESFSGALGRSMDDFMRENQNPDDSALANYERRFKRSLKACKDIWGENAFHRPEGQSWRDQTLAGMYDAQMISIALLSDDLLRVLRREPRRAIRAVRELFQDSEFDAAVRQGTNTPSRVRYRIEHLTGKLRQVARAA